MNPIERIMGGSLDDYYVIAVRKFDYFARIIDGSPEGITSPGLSVQLLNYNNNTVKIEIMDNKMLIERYKAFKSVTLPVEPDEGIYTTTTYCARSSRSATLILSTPFVQEFLMKVEDKFGISILVGD
jgi:hypothetical protein